MAAIRFFLQTWAGGNVPFLRIESWSLSIIVSTVCVCVGVWVCLDSTGMFAVWLFHLRTYVQISDLCKVRKLHRVAWLADSGRRNLVLPSSTFCRRCRQTSGNSCLPAWWGLVLKTSLCSPPRLPAIFIRPVTQHIFMMVVLRPSKLSLHPVCVVSLC